jgi:hypothetical protein
MCCGVVRCTKPTAQRNGQAPPATYLLADRRSACATAQGLAEAREVEDFDGRKFSIALLSRKGRLHVGPRYKARGLNTCAEPGNEIECEQVSGRWLRGWA